MPPLILAAGRAAEHTLSLPSPLAAGTASLALTGASTDFAPGDQLFICDSSSTDTQWLGRVASSSPTALAWTRPLIAPKSDGAKLWRAASFLSIPCDVHLPATRRIEPGVAIERARSGDFFAVQFAQPTQAFDLALSTLTPQTESAAIAWLESIAGFGLVPFTLVTAAGEVVAVRLTGGAITRTRQPGDLRALTLPLILAGEGLYQ